jgi:hypothetical protein
MNYCKVQVEGKVYAVVLFDFLYIGVPMLFVMAVFAKIVIGNTVIPPEAVASYKAIKDAILSEIMIQSQQRIIIDLHIYVLGAFLFKKLGKYGTQGIVAFACARAGVDPEKALQALKNNDEDRPKEVITPTPVETIPQENAP